MKTECRWYFPVYLSITVCYFATLAISPVVAASLGDIPVTAEYAAGLRAIAAMDPDEKIRNPDYMAHQFLTPAFWFWGSLSPDYEKSKKFIKFYRVGGYYASNACTKHIDGILEKLAHNGLTQVVNIGAGLDSRPYRFGKQMPDVRFFEVDLPAAVARKKELVAAALGQLSKNVAYVPIDYQTHGLASALLQAGYDKNAKTLFIWEGVTRHMNADAVNRILAFIAAHAAAQSELVFDYIPEGLVRGDYKSYPAARFRALRMTALGHPWTFGIDRDRAAAFVSQHGLDVVSDLDAQDLAHRYLIRSDGTIDGKPTAFVRIMHAVVEK
jgi:methyltransferase (TIGR00027 family)